MRICAALMFMAVLLMGTSCVNSKHPLSDAEKAVADPKLKGVWKLDNNQGDEASGYAFMFIEPLMDLSSAELNDLYWQQFSFMNSVGFGSNFSETYGFVTVKGDKRYLNISAMHSEDQNGDTTPINWKQLREQGDKKKFLAAIPYYSIVKYEVKGDKLHLWHQDPDFVQDAIAKKQIAGEEGRITAESKKVLEFITENDAKVFAEEMVFTRVK